MDNKIKIFYIGKLVIQRIVNYDQNKVNVIQFLKKNKHADVKIIL